MLVTARGFSAPQSFTDGKATRVPTAHSGCFQSEGVAMWPLERVEARAASCPRPSWHDDSSSQSAVQRAPHGARWLPGVLVVF